jgi:hypothetical protein
MMWICHVTTDVCLLAKKVACMHAVSCEREREREREKENLTSRRIQRERGVGLLPREIEGDGQKKKKGRTWDPQKNM